MEEWKINPTQKITRGHDSIWPVEHPTEHRTVYLSARGATWLPGCYDNIEAAKAAFGYHRYRLHGIYVDVKTPLTVKDLRKDCIFS